MLNTRRLNHVFNYQPKLRSLQFNQMVTKQYCSKTPTINDLFRHIKQQTNNHTKIKKVNSNIIIKQNNTSQFKLEILSRIQLHPQPHLGLQPIQLENTTFYVLKNTAIFNKEPNMVVLHSIHRADDSLAHKFNLNCCLKSFFKNNPHPNYFEVSFIPQFRSKIGVFFQEWQLLLKQNPNEPLTKTAEKLKLATLLNGYNYSILKIDNDPLIPKFIFKKN